MYFASRFVLAYTIRDYIFDHVERRSQLQALVVGACGG